MTARTRHIRRSRRTPRPRAFPFPLFLIMVCAAVTIGATAIRALTGDRAAGHTGMGVALAGTAGRVMAFLDYFAGVFTLLSLTAAVVCGLAATDRLVLRARHRIAMQSVHRATSVAALGFLLTHIAVKVAERDATPLVALLPFGGGATFAVSLGTVAADLLVLTAATGAVRGRFAGSRRPWLWRLLHSAAYASWPIALAHGLTAGRQAAVWVLWSYGLCAAVVGLALLVRLLGAAGRGSARRRTERTLLAYQPRPRRGSGRDPLADEPLTTATHARLRLHPDAPTPAPVMAPVMEQVPVPIPVPVPVPVPVPEPVGFAPEFAHAQYTAYAFHPQAGYHPQAPYPPQYAAYGYGHPAPAPWAGDGQGLPHPSLTETPPHGFAFPGAPIWDTPAQGVPVGVHGSASGGHGGGW